MTPLDLDTRVGKLETDAARVGQRVDDLATTVRTFAPMAVSLTKLEMIVEGLHDDIAKNTVSIAEVRDALKQESRERAAMEKQRAVADDERARTARAESRSLRLVLISLAVTIFLGLLGFAGALIGAGVL